MTRSSVHAVEGVKETQSPSVRRALALAAILVLWMIVALLRLYDLQVIQYVPLLARAERQQQRVVEISPQRGTIYDCHMHPLAMSLPVDSIYAVPSQVSDPAMAASLLAPILKLDPQELAGHMESSRSFCWIKRKVTAQEAARVEALGLDGVYFQKENKRFYPKGELAAQVLGYVGLDDSGLAGVEYETNSLIRGRPGKVLLDSDARRRSFRSVQRAGEPGDNVVLTLDQTVQYIAEKELAKTVAKFHAAGGVVIVQNPNTGDILAMASRPTLDPNQYNEIHRGGAENRAVSWIYEPGSTFKLVTVSATLEEGLATPNDVIDCQEGSIVLANHVIHDHERFGDLTVSQILMHSSNVGAIKLGLRLGERRLYDWILRFGFDQRTGAELAGEERGLLEPPTRWSGISIGELSVGQGVSVTPLQMVDAYSAIANDGVMMKPHIIRAVYEGQEPPRALPPVGRRVVSPQTAEEIRQMLEGVVLGGTGRPAQLDGYSSAGKTGTAQKVGVRGHYSHTHYVASFIGFAPVQHPAITILVAIDTPKGAIYGDQVAAPAFKAIAEQTLGYLNVPQDVPSPRPQLASRTPATLPRQQRGTVAGDPSFRLEAAGVATRSVLPVAYTKPYSSSMAGTILVDEGPQVVVPDFLGLDARQVARKCLELGLRADLSGMGLAVEQSPSAQAQVPNGTEVRVRLAR